MRDTLPDTAGVADLPDLPALRQLERALWKMGRTRGAAILVGAGFSRNARRVQPNIPVLPLWQDLAEAMEARLGSPRSGARDPLRMAEEFRAVQGHAALEGLIRELIPDEQWIPGELHEMLVALPWVDILTTNWDTLLERAAATALEQNYEVVRCLEDIATTRSPRVVKLHGSLPSNRPFIVSEEDYRTYPRKFAPFVNLVQQVLLENELCLLGFSGDDPNFLKWSGWIRDNLGQLARRIYLVGALDLSPAQRRLLDTRNVSPIDLSPLVADVEHNERASRAAELFLNYLRAARPKPSWKWQSRHSIPSALWQQNSSDQQQAASLAEVLKQWKTVRRSYPGWAVCPPDLQRGLKQDTPHVLANRKALAAMPARDRVSIVFEGAWRLNTAFLPTAPWSPTLEAVVEDVPLWDDLQQRDFLLILLLRAAREDRNEPAFKKWIAELEQRAERNTDASSYLAYEKCLWARDGFDFAGLHKLVATVLGNDPLWSLRRSALYSYLGDFQTARACAQEALISARGLYARDRSSIWALSRLAWCQFCIGALRDWTERTTTDDDKERLTSKIHETKCEPWDVFSAFDEEIDGNLRRLSEANRTIEPEFDAGTYRDHRSTVRFGSSPDLVIYAIDRLADSIGIPARTQNIIVLSPRMARAEPLASYDNDADYLRLLRIIHTDQPEVLKRRFGRLSVANLAANRVAFLKGTLSEALTYSLVQVAKRENWIDQFWTHRAAAYTEVLSRLLVRADQEEATRWLHKALMFGHDPRWQTAELCEPLEHLIKRALSAISPLHRSHLLPSLISFPMPEETVLGEPFHRDWPNLSETLEESVLMRDKLHEVLKERIATLTRWVRNGKPETRGRAAAWLMQLQFKELLTPEEGQQFADALWSRRPSSTDFPADTNFRSHVFVIMPSSYQDEALGLLRQRNHEDSSADYLIAMAGTARLRTDGSRLQPFDRSEALNKLKLMLKWQPQAPPTLDLGQIGRQNELSRRYLGTAIADAILPMLKADDLSNEMIEEIFSREADVLPIVQAYPELVRLSPSHEVRAIKGILRAMLSRDSTDAWAGFNALYRWVKQFRLNGDFAVPRTLIEATVSTVENRREPGLLQALNLARLLGDADLLHTGDLVERLASALGLIYIESTYDAALNENAISVTTLTLVRAAAVRLVRSLKIKGSANRDIDIWLNAAPTDPMPEVRFALELPE